jgi:hypothetical protein
MQGVSQLAATNKRYHLLVTPNQKATIIERHSKV